jgi:hypothetical protein
VAGEVGNRSVAALVLRPIRACARARVMGSYSGGIVPSAGAELQGIRDARVRPRAGRAAAMGFNRHTTRLALRVRAPHLGEAPQRALMLHRDWDQYSARIRDDKFRSRWQSYRSAACRRMGPSTKFCLDSGNSGCIGRMGQARAGVVADARRRGRHVGDHTSGALRTPAGTYPTGQ